MTLHNVTFAVVWTPPPLGPCTVLVRQLVHGVIAPGLEGWAEAMCVVTHDRIDIRIVADQWKRAAAHLRASLESVGLLAFSELAWFDANELCWRDIHRISRGEFKSILADPAEVQTVIEAYSAGRRTLLARFAQLAEASGKKA